MPAPEIRPAWPLLAAALAVASFVAMDATVKTLAARYDALHLTFFRFASGSAFALGLWLWRRSPLPRAAEWRWHLVRCALLLVTLVGYFHSLKLLPLAQAVAMGYIAPIAVALLSLPVLGERPSRSTWAALVLGTAGVGVALWPELRASGANPRVEGLLAAGGAALAFAGVMLLARKLAQRDSVWTILLLQNVLPALMLAGPVAWQWQAPAAADWLPIFLAGAFATVGLLGVTWAFAHLEASRVAPLEYTSFVWAALLGYELFGEVPSLHTVASAALIVVGCLLLLRR